MKKLIYLGMLIFLVPYAMADSSNQEGLAISYATAIAQAEMRQQSNRGPELRRCVQHWTDLRVKRTHLPQMAIGKSGSVLLEIGNSGFPRYDYIHVNGMSLSSSFFSTETDISQLDLGTRLKELYSNFPDNFISDAYGEIDDGDCYFLTLSDGNSWRTVVAYGIPKSTPVGLLIGELIKVARNLK